jgi:hypothetical protein
MIESIVVPEERFDRVVVEKIDSRWHCIKAAGKLFDRG